MNAGIGHNWELALRYLEDARAAIMEGKPLADIREKLWWAIVYGQKMTKYVNPRGEEGLIGAGIALEALEQSGRPDIKRVFNMVVRTFEKYHNLVHAQDYLPLPTKLK